jgi:hypothetical protein
MRPMLLLLLLVLLLPVSQGSENTNNSIARAWQQPQQPRFCKSNVAGFHPGASAAILAQAIFGIRLRRAP